LLEAVEGVLWLPAVFSAGLLDFPRQES